ncbi:hypothetical protein AEA09_09090 [Lysinibacillus contaminans]|uniref:DNA mismatch repair protein MutT n=1 Tax=Lysinibacillus contaminans TaxID=1293441 RepID=A0ABR5K1R0_9BACI|nr:hypothetical protein [Lysinibacillus contaminans]KOS68680.1 hypothetical protein AEA09_09090 [Lysinibacillus contaminans]
MENIYIGDIISTAFILFIMVIIIIVIIGVFKMVFAKAKQPASQSDSALVQQVYELTMRINTLEQQMDELKKKSL